MNGKMLMFCKTFIQSFVYDLIDVFMYPNNKISKIYDKYEIQISNTFFVLKSN